MGEIEKQIPQGAPLFSRGYLRGSNTVNKIKKTGQCFWGLKFFVCARLTFFVFHHPNANFFLCSQYFFCAARGLALRAAVDLLNYLLLHGIIKVTVLLC
jgi:hypothetical protein